MFQHDEQQQLRRRKRMDQQHKRPILLRQLQQELKNLNEISPQISLDILEKKDIYSHDVTLEKLQSLKRQADKHQLTQIKRLCSLAVGKRILNLQLLKQTQQYTEKKEKKKQVQDFFRQNRIKKIDYDFIQQEEINKFTFVARAYSTGRGFVQSTKKYEQQYSTALRQQLIKYRQCKFLQTIRRINEIFFKNYSSKKQKDDKSLGELVFRFSWLPIIIFYLLTLSYPFISFPQQEIVLLVLLIFILIIMLTQSIQAYRNKPSDNNHIQQTVSDIKQYFDNLNYKSQKENPRPFQWTLCDDLMFVKVKFKNGFPL